MCPPFWAPSPQYLPHLQGFQKSKLFIEIKNREFHFSSDTAISGSQFKYITPQKNICVMLLDWTNAFYWQTAKFWKNFRKQLYPQKSNNLVLFILYIEFFFPEIESSFHLSERAGFIIFVETWKTLSFEWAWGFQWSFLLTFAGFRFKLSHSGTFICQKGIFVRFMFTLGIMWANSTYYKLRSFSFFLYFN